MALKDRQENILQFLREKHEASISELCHALYVSEPTMRRDLAALHKAGKIIRTHGGALYRQELGENLPQELRERERADAKAIIGRKCLAMVRDGDTVMVDGSSSAAALLQEIGVKKSIVVITNSAKAPLILADTKLKILVTGGELAPNTYAYVGSYAEEFLRGFHADICFFSVRTLTPDGDLTDNAIAENAVRKIMLARARRSVLLLDSEKLGEPCISTLCSLSDIDYVVSERDISSLFPTYQEKFL